MDELEAIQTAQSTPGYSMRTLAENLSITYREIPMQKEVSVVFSHPHHGEYEIIVNREKRVTARRWAGAHAISHFFMHRDLLLEGCTHIDTDYSGKPYGKDDVLCAYDEQASQFAIRLLMPSHLIRKTACTTPLKDLFGVFQVTPAAMNIRLKNMGILASTPKYEGSNIIPWPGNPNSSDDHPV